MMRFVLPRRFFLVAAIVGGLTVTIGLILLSPFALAELAHFRTDWSRLSNIGQTYGAASAIVSSLALGGVVISLLYQARDSRNALEQATRTLQFELIRMELQDSSLMTAMGAPWDLPIPSDSTFLREYLYVQMWVSFWGGNYAAGELSEATVRHFAAHELFRSQAGRSYWTAVGKLQLSHSKGRLNKFFHLLEDEYKKAVASGVPVVNTVKKTGPPTRPQATPAINPRPLRRLCMVAGAAALGALAGSFWRRRSQQP
jgi:hypothetical protein